MKTPAPPAGRAALGAMLRAQTALELRLTLRRGESVLVTVLLPALLLLFFSTVPLIALAPADPGVPPAQAVYPAVLAVAVMSTGMVSLGIATAFERQYGVLKRLGGSPLPRPLLVWAKVMAVLAVEVVQVALLTALALALGWRPPAAAGGAPLALAGIALVLGTIAFAGIGLSMAGSWRAEATLAGANGLYLVLLLLGGIFVPPEALPAPLGAITAFLPSAALAGLLRAALGPPALAGGGAAPAVWPDLIVLAAWAAGAALLAAATFRWE